MLGPVTPLGWWARVILTKWLSWNMQGHGQRKFLNLDPLSIPPHLSTSLFAIASCFLYIYITLPPILMLAFLFLRYFASLMLTDRRVHVTVASRVNSDALVTAQRSETLTLTMTTNQAFFSSAASSFYPMPYVPSARPSAPGPFRNQRPHDIPPAGMDPQPTDPNVVFIHPPFKTFPDSHLHSDGLTYALMADNPEWFLDANDFTSEHNSNPRAISYPSHLEPPRGWCPAKKKDLKERGSEGWPEGEEPRLRCTFCRRTYAGVNAKSMWRRHVFEKHKIAMSNRRDGNDRPRGRGSGSKP